LLLLAQKYRTIYISWVTSLPSYQQSKHLQIVKTTFNTTNLNNTWETWHKRFGHLGNSSIKTLIDKKLVTGLNIDLKSPQYDCEACVQAKQHVAPFPKASVGILTKPGEVTHMDLWKKYPVQSINSYQYFHSFLDDSTCQPCITLLKHISEATQAIKDYVTHLQARGMQPNMFRCDQGVEFVNDNLKNWFHKQEIDLQMTVPYSPSQNGAAERLNCTLVKLAQAMLIGANVPMFLWEYALQHAACCIHVQVSFFQGFAWHNPI
jgi:hypothetical protein